MPYVYIGGSRGVSGARPLQDPILSCAHTFSPKSTCFGDPRPLREILDPPLVYITNVCMNINLYENKMVAGYSATRNGSGTISTLSQVASPRTPFALANLGRTPPHILLFLHTF